MTPTNNPDRLLGLAERVEAASGPDRQLDALITVALDLRPDWLANTAGELWFKGEMIGDNPVIRFTSVASKRRHPGNPPSGHCPRFTASLDAALLLVPEGPHGSHWGLNSKDRKHGTATAYVTLYDLPDDGTYGDQSPFTATAATPALALTAAALKARALAMKEGSAGS